MKDKKRGQCVEGIDQTILTGFHDTLKSDVNQVQILTELATKFTPKKVNTMKLADAYYELDLTGRAIRVRECGTYFEFKVTEEKSKVSRANFCKDRLGPMCNWRRSLKIYGQVSQIMDVVEKTGLKFIFLTLTVRNCKSDELPITVDKLLQGWRYLYNQNKEFKKIAKGTIRTLEVTRNKKTGEYHPHLHVIIAVKSDYFSNGYISQIKWSKLWQDACDLEYRPIVDVRRITEKEDTGIIGAVAEISKYAVKDSDYLEGEKDEVKANVSHLLYALTRRHLCSFTGIFGDVRRSLNLDDVEDGNLVNVNNELRQDIAIMIVRYHWKSGVYVQI